MKKFLLLLGLFGFQVQAQEEESSARVLAANCFSCHTPLSETEPLPSLTHLSAEQIRRDLQAFQLNQRDSTVMNRICRGLTPEEIERIAGFLGKKP
jgi:cytochrome c553